MLAHYGQSHHDRDRIIVHGVEICSTNVVAICDLGASAPLLANCDLSGFVFENTNVERHNDNFKNEFGRVLKFMYRHPDPGKCRSVFVHPDHLETMGGQSTATAKRLLRKTLRKIQVYFVNKYREFTRILADPDSRVSDYDGRLFMLMNDDDFEIESIEALRFSNFRIRNLTAKCSIPIVGELGRLFSKIQRTHMFQVDYEPERAPVNIKIRPIGTARPYVTVYSTGTVLLKGLRHITDAEPIMQALLPVLLTH